MESLAVDGGGALLSGTAECALRVQLHTPASFFCAEVSQPQWSFQSVPTETDTFATRILEWGRAALGSERANFNRFAAMVRDLTSHLAWVVSETTALTLVRTDSWFHAPTGDTPGARLAALRALIRDSHQLHFAPDSTNARPPFLPGLGPDDALAMEEQWGPGAS